MELEERELFTLRRRRAGVTQRDVALRAGTARPMVSAWERGRMELGADTRQKLWAALKELAAAGTEVAA
jgi:transcriptional regulator with XRE-family HTH domain